MFELLVPAQLGFPAGPELLIVLGIAVLLFGANKIPKLARSSGEAMGEFKKGRQEIEQQLKEGKADSTESAADATESATDSAEPTTESAEPATKTSE